MKGFTGIECPNWTRNVTLREPSLLLNQTGKKWWLFVALSISFLIVGQTSAVLLRRFYNAEGGSSMFVATLVQTAGFPILCVPLILLPPSSKTSASSDLLAKKYIVLIYISIGVLLAGNNLLSSVGLLYLSASTYSLICATQLAYGAVFSCFINSQKITPLILNSVVILSFSTAILAVTDESHASAGVSKQEYAFGIICSIGSAAVYPVVLSMIQLTFDRVLKAESFRVVLEMQIYTSLVASVVSICGLFASGQWKDLSGEMNNFDTGPASYIMTSVWTAICCQVSSVGVVGLIFLVSCLFSNVVSTVALAAAPIASLIVFHDNMTGVKAITMLLTLWGLASYLFQTYLDESRATKLPTQMQPPRDISGVAT